MWLIGVSNIYSVFNDEMILSVTKCYNLEFSDI